MTPGFIVNHLWQSSWFAALAALLAFALRGNSPRVRYRIWLTASLKFLVPWSVLASLGSLVKWPAGHAIPVSAPVFQSTLTQIAEPVSMKPYAIVPIHGSTHWMWTAICLAWAFGFATIAFVRIRAWLRVRAALHAATPIDLPIPVPAFITTNTVEPGIFGFLRPALILPARLPEQLSPPQFEAILAHELCHVRRRDNLFAAIHMVVEAAFWFHPLVWWIGTRMIEERERACDEEVLRMGCEPEDYVEGILKVCRFYRESPLPCVSGVTGADVKERLRAILAGSIARELTFGRKLVLTAIGMAALAAPVFIGMLNAPRAGAFEPAPQVEKATPLVAQDTAPKNSAPQVARPAAEPVAPPPQFEVASIKRVAPVPDSGPFEVPAVSGGIGTSDPQRITYRLMPLQALIFIAFGIRQDQITGPAWLATERYEIQANIPPGTTPEQFKLMLGNLLRERFHLVFHIESRDRSVYAITVARGGHKLKEFVAASVADEPPPKGIGQPDKEGYPLLPNYYKGTIARPKDGQLLVTGQGASVAQLTYWLEGAAGRPIVDETGLTGLYDFRIHFEQSHRADNPGVASDPAPTVFDAVEGQLGLKLEARRSSSEFLIVDSIDREPTAN